MQPSSNRRYVVESIVHASQVLSAFRSAGELLRLRDVVGRTGLNKMMCFRLLYTLRLCGFIEKVGANQYRILSNLLFVRKHVIGYAAPGLDASFAREVGASLVRAAENAHVELVTVDNRYDSKTALRNASRLVRENVELAIEFQADELVAPAVAAKFMEANIPLIAIDIPHPGATYFGANNYDAGLIAGRHLGRWANKRWGGAVDEVIMVEVARAGSLPHARIRGILAGLSETIQPPDQWRVFHVDGDGMYGPTYERIRKHLRTSKAKHILVGAATDPSALGALRAFEEVGRAANCAIVGQNADPEGRAELRQSRTRLVGSVAYFPESYGASIIRLALDILARKATPPAVFIKHQLITPENVDHFYANDALMHVGVSPI
jgi:ribose transport system substrate-binding protein